MAARDASCGFELLGSSASTMTASVLRCLVVRVAADGLNTETDGDQTVPKTFERVLLHLTVHHVAFDGGSTGLLLGELGVLYARFVSVCHGGTTDEVHAMGGSSLSVLPFEYVDFASWQRSGALAPHLVSHRAYWRSMLREGDLPVLELPLDYPRPALQTFNGSVVPVSIDAATASRLEAAGRAHGCTMFQAMLCVWSIVLCRHAAQEEVVIGCPFHGRDVVGTDLWWATL